MRLVNGWNYLYKNWDRVEFRLRISIITIFEIYLDFSDREYSITVLNFKLRSSK